MVKYLDNNSGFRQWNAAQSAQKKKGFGLSGFLWWCLVFMAVWWMVGLFMGPRDTNVSNTSDVPVIDISNVPVNTIASDMISATVQGLRISDVKLADFAASPDDTARVALLADDGAYAEIGLVGATSPAPTPQTLWNLNDGIYSWRNSDGVEFRRTLSIDGYVITVRDEIINNGKSDTAFAPYARIVRGDAANSNAGVATGAVIYADDDITREDWRRIERKSYVRAGADGFVGFADQYWETLVDIDAVDQTWRVKKTDGMFNADAVAGAISVAPGATREIVTHLYAGPRDVRALRDAATMIPGAPRTMDYGWFWFLSRPLLWLINMINAIVMNYGIAIIIMTILLRTLMWPLTRKSYASMIAMQKMQPEMARLQKLYANDKMRLQMEMLNLYRSHKTSPMSGCLPMLIQIPIFFALYKALLISVQMRSAHFLWISDLAAMDPYFILPILMGATMWLQQRMQTGKRTAKSDSADATAQMQRAMRWMPILFAIMFAWMPAGLVLYWTTSNIFAIGQIYVMQRRNKK